MKARIVKPQTMFYGEVHKNGRWERVTIACFTKWGAKRELDKWRQENHPRKFEI